MTAIDTAMMTTMWVRVTFISERTHATLDAMRKLLLGFLVLGVVSCKKGALSDPPPPQFPVVIRVDSDPGIPLAGASVFRKEQLLGKTSADGKLPITFTGTEGDVLEVRVTCPADYTSPTAPLLVPLRKLSDAKPPEYTAKCPPNYRKVVIVIRAENGPFVPIKHLGQMVGRTDASGTATLLANARPNESLEFTLNTSADEAFKRHSPVDPTVQYLVQPQDEVVVLNQSFDVAKPPPVYIAPKPKPQPILPRRTF